MSAMGHSRPAGAVSPRGRVLVAQSAQLSSLRNPGALVASAQFGVVSAQRQSQVAVLNSRCLRRYVTVRSMPKRVLARGALHQRPLKRMTVLGLAA
jgi:hypothetical protein